jgi:hypothetical protein
MIEESVPAAEATVCTMLFLVDRRVLEGAQHGHRDDRRRNRRGEGQADLETEVDVGRGEDQRDQRAERAR